MSPAEMRCYPDRHGRWQDRGRYLVKQRDGTIKKQKNLERESERERQRKVREEEQTEEDERGVKRPNLHYP